MGPEIPTAAADQNFAWICKQHQDLIDSVLIFRTKIIWSGPEFGLVRCGYLNTAIVEGELKDLQLFHNEWEHYQFSPLYNDISVLCILNNTAVTIWWVPNINKIHLYSLKLFIGLQVSVATRFCRVLIFASSQYLSVIYLFHVMIHWWVRKPPRGPNDCMFWAMTEAEGEVGYP